MKSLKILFILLFVAQYTYSQNSENIKKVTFNYSVGGNSWKNGIYSRQEIIEFTKNKKNDFKLSKHLRIVFTRKDKKYIKDTIQIQNNSIIPKYDLLNLIKELNTNQENYTEAFLKKEFTKLTKKEILKIAEKTNYLDYFINNEDDKEEIKEKYLQIQEYKYLDKYLESNKPIINNLVTITSDAWDNLTIITNSEKELKEYKLQFFDSPSGQPLVISNYISKKLENKVINLNVNLIIKKIIPKNSEIYNIININKIKFAFLCWFFENKSNLDFELK